MAAASMARSTRPTANARRDIQSGGPKRQAFADKRQERAYYSPPNERLSHEKGGGCRGGGTGFGEEESPRSAGGAYEDWLAEGRYAMHMRFDWLAD